MLNIYRIEHSDKIPKVTEEVIPRDADIMRVSKRNEEMADEALAAVKVISDGTDDR